MPLLISTSTPLTATLFAWQELIGSLLGTFLAILVTAGGFYIKRCIDAVDRHQNTLRLIIVELTGIVNDTVQNIKAMRAFANGLQKMRTKILATPAGVYSIEQMNFPSYSKIFLPKDLVQSRTRSLYLHNTLLGLAMGSTSSNLSLEELRHSFMEILRKNEFLIVNKADHANQISIYAQNIDQFSIAIESFLQSLRVGLRVMLAAKYYTEKLKKFFILVHWKYEDRSFKFFMNRTEFENYATHPRNLERINFGLRDRVEEIVSKV